MRWLFRIGGRIAPRLAARAMATLVSQPRGRNPTQAWELNAAPGRIIELRPGLFAEAWGESGPLVLALHGWRGRTTQFRPLAALLLARGYRTIAVDLPGHGGSTGRHVTPHLLGELLVDLAAELGPVHAAIGHSFGGAGIGAALLLGFRPSRLVIVSSPTRVSRIPFIYAGMLGLPERAMPHFAKLMDEHAGRPIAELDLVAAAPRCGIPALLVHDTEDAVIPYSEAEALAAAWPELQFMTTTGKGHRDILSNAAVLQRITEFVAGN
ncbi:MAG: alpha/beta fold hydrolase [Steroidobacteraceae bacterium]